MKRLFLIIVGLFVSLVGYSQAFNTVDEAYSMLITNVNKYVQWEKVDGSFDILVLNNSNLAKNLKKFYGGKKIAGQDVVVSEDKNSRTDYSGIEVLISNHKAATQDNLLTFNLNDTNAIINLVQEDEKMKIKIRKHSADNNKIRISSALTSISKIIDNNVVESKPVEAKTDSTQH